jgi:hypothetical protein
VQGGSQGLIGGFGQPGHRGIPPCLGAAVKDGISAQQRTSLGRAVKGQEIVDAAHLPLPANGAEAVIDPLMLQEGIQIGNVGLKVQYAVATPLDHFDFIVESFHKSTGIPMDKVIHYFF